MGVGVGAVGWGTCASIRQVAGSIPEGVVGIFRWLIPSGHTGSGVDSASNRNEYQVYLLEG
jgi:hypothetical protein